MLLQKSIIFLVLFYIAMSLSHPTLDKKLKARSKRKSLGQTKSKKKKSESDCVQDFCEKDTAYPTADIQKLLKENSWPQISPFYMTQYEAPMTRSAVHQEHLCQVITRTLKPKRAATGFGTKEYVVQSENIQQSLYIEACMSEEPKLLDKLGCLPDGHDVICQQQYRLIPLVVFDEKRKNFTSTQFKVPSGCTVHFTKVEQRKRFV